MLLQGGHFALSKSSRCGDAAARAFGVLLLLLPVLQPAISPTAKFSS
jgi:hypothetical protein